MRIIGLEEHCWTPEIATALAALPAGERDQSLQVFQTDLVTNRLEDLGEGRLREMDKIGLDMMVLSITSPGTQSLPPDQAVALARQANDRLAAAVAAHPDRLQAFATLPTPDPNEAVKELQRSVTDLGLKGAMIHGRTRQRYLDAPELRPILAKAAELNVPIYLHPQIATRQVREVLYDGFDERLSIGFACSGWGWHADTGVAILRLILSGVFDELPSLQFILGHWGETVMTFLERANSLTTWTQERLKRPVADYFHSNCYITGSGIYFSKYLLEAVEIMGVDRVMYSTDYPFRYNGDGLARTFLEQAPLSYDDKVKIAHSNAERLLKL